MSEPSTADFPIANGTHGAQVKQGYEINGSTNEARTRCHQPISYSGLLDSYTYKDVTPAIGREFTNIQLADLLASPNRDALITDLAVTISQRGVVFLRNQTITGDQMQELTSLISNLAGSPSSSGLHIHPLSKNAPELGAASRPPVGIISSEAQKQGGGITHQRSDYSKRASVGWHSDITFEPVPSDYAMLKIHTLPPTGGDTLWASGYQMYDNLSPAMRTFLENLTATHDANFFHEDASRLGHTIQSRIRGSPLNTSTDLRATHPVIRTNPVTGWKSVFVNRGFTKRINGVTKDESDLLLNYLYDLVVHNHDGQVRFGWHKNDVAVWDNRCTVHCATYDYAEERIGDRACSLGEKPYLDRQSKCRSKVLGLERNVRLS